MIDHSFSSLWCLPFVRTAYLRRKLNGEGKMSGSGPITSSNTNEFFVELLFEQLSVSMCLLSLWPIRPICKDFQLSFVFPVLGSCLIVSDLLANLIHSSLFPPSSSS
mmetsp:Transcript_42172/g.59018  ORF Transcript_42172/g.59018 Transcript_42172/m.59018 type:complete len:107 (+) Transcript_42172:1234-1554(+)